MFLEKILYRFLLLNRNKITGLPCFGFHGSVLNWIYNLRSYFVTYTLAIKYAIRALGFFSYGLSDNQLSWKVIF